MFDPKAKGLNSLLKALIVHQKQITEHGLVRC
jgi:hypothetical protein